MWMFNLMGIHDHNEIHNTVSVIPKFIHLMLLLYSCTKCYRQERHLLLAKGVYIALQIHYLWCTISLIEFPKVNKN